MYIHMRRCFSKSLPPGGLWHFFLPVARRALQESEQPAEPAEPVDVESLRLQVRDALGEASFPGMVGNLTTESLLKSSQSS